MIIYKEKEDKER